MEYIAICRYCALEKITDDMINNFYLYLINKSHTFSKILSLEFDMLLAVT